jgi:general secretion pathway protein G
MSNTQSNGFTLIELMVVIVLVGMLAGIVGTQVFSLLEGAKVDLAETQIKELQGAVALFKLDRGHFPSALDDLLTASKRYPHGYLEAIEVPEDPWGGTYILYPEGGTVRPYLIASSGPDQVEDSDDDVTNE